MAFYSTNEDANMTERPLEDIVESVEPWLDDFDQIARIGHSRYRNYTAEDLVELDSRAQAACTYCHMIAEAERRFLDIKHIRPMEIRGLKLWLFEKADVVVRFKKMDEDGQTRNYPTKQAKDFDRGYDLPGLPMPPVRITAGYLLDRTGTVIERAQLARPLGQKRTMWCVAIVPQEDRVSGERIWKDVTRQGQL
jgi:hypothetical protein